MRPKGVCLCLVLLLAATALAQSGPEEALLKADRDFNAATQTRRAAGWMEWMADNVVVLTPEAPVVGREAVAKFYEETFANPDFQLTWEPTRAEVIGGGDVGYTVGRYKMSAKNQEGKAFHRTGSYLTTWRKQADGRWKVVADVGSPDPPASK